MEKKPASRRLFLPSAKRSLGFVFKGLSSMAVLDFASCGPHMFATSANRGILEVRLKLVAVAGLFALFATGSVQAMEMRQKDADDFRAGLLSSYPDLADSDFLTVKPAGDRLEVTLDFNGFFDGLDPKTFRMTGFGPWSFFFTPQDNNVAKLNAENSVKASLLAKGVDGKVIEGNFTIGSFVLDGLIDLNTSGVQLNTSAWGVDFLSKIGERQAVFLAGKMDNTINWRASSAGNGHVDYSGSWSLSDYYQEASQSQVPDFKISAAKIDHEYHLNDVPKKEFNSLILSLFANGGGSFKDLEDFEKFRTLLTASFPILSFLNESVSAANLTVTSPLVNLAAGYLSSAVILQGQPDAMRLAWAVKAQDMKMYSQMVPAAYWALLPNNVDMQVLFEGLDFASAGNELITAQVQTKDDVRAMGEKFSEKLIGSKSMSISLKQLKLISGVYDLKIFGTVRKVDGKNPQLELWISAHDFDKSIAAVQELTKKAPDLSQVSFGMMMAKGFADTNSSDGSLLWAVVWYADGSVTVNGQSLRGPHNADQR
jgi:hypothetical protein